MKTKKILLLGATMAMLSLLNACSPTNSNAESPAPTSVASAPSNPPAPAGFPDSPVTVATPATVPTNIAPTSPLAQVVRLAQAGVDESIIMVYITNSSRTFNLDSDKIIYLTDLGLPADAVTAMMQRDQLLQQQFAASQAELQLQQLQQTQTPQTAPVPEPSVASTTENTTPPAPVTINYFNDTLSPYGNWVAVGGYGNCWRPAVAVYNPTWQPYCDRGRWIYTDCGWYWSSEYAWGATFHYGRWFRDASVGWCWYPDTVWAPSWVTWRYSDNYCGWAPLPPRTYCQPGVGIVYQGGGVGIGLSFGLAASCFTFVPTQYFCNSHPRNYAVGHSQTTQIFNNSTVINNIRIHGSGNNQIIINNGIPVQNVANTTQTPIRPVPVHQIDRAFAHAGGSPAGNRPVGAINGNHGNFGGNADSVVRPSTSARNDSTAATTQNNPQPPVFNSSHENNRPAQNHFAAPMNNQLAQAGPGEPSPASVQSQPAPNYSAPVAHRPAPAANYQSHNYPTTVQAPPANFNNNSQPAPANWPQPAASRTYTHNSAPPQNNGPPSQVSAPPVTYVPQPSPSPQSHAYSQPHNEPRQNYSPAPAPAPPQPASQSQINPPAQSQRGGHGGTQNWPR